MQLYYYESLNPQKACAVARHLELPVEFVRVDLAKGEHKAPDYLVLNPNGRVPTLIDGDVRLWEADAIMGYLAKSARSDLLPDDERLIDVMRWLSWASNHFTRHAGNLYFQHVIKPNFLKAEPDPAAVEEASGYLRQFAAVLDEHLKGRKYLVGDGLTIADFAVGVTLPHAEKAKLPIGGFKEIARWHDRLSELPAWRQPFPAGAQAAP